MEQICPTAGASGASLADFGRRAGYRSEHLFGRSWESEFALLVLGVDPGLTRCGLGVVAGAPGVTLDLVAVDVVKTPADLDLGRRLVLLEEAVESWLTAHRPEAVAVEQVFSQRNVRTVMGTAQASGVVIAAAARRGLPVGLHTPSEVKAAVTGNGRADKAQVAAMVTRLLRLAAPPRPADAADALALAICHIWRAPARPGSRCGSAVAGQPAAGSGPMIASLSGTVTAVSPDGAVIEVGGVGIAVVATPGTIATLRVGEPVRLATSLVVREDALTLYGFTTDDERGVFETLQSVAGVGPRLAQAVLAVHPPDAVRVAVMTDDVAAFMLVPGIGRKGAQRILLELKDRLGAPVETDRVLRLPGQAGPDWREQLRSALIGLGWTGREVGEALTAVAPEAADGDPDVAVLLKRSLQLLSRA